jgi:hypothetical protein
VTMMNTSAKTDADILDLDSEDLKHTEQIEVLVFTDEARLQVIFLHCYFRIDFPPSSQKRELQ